MPQMTLRRITGRRRRRAFSLVETLVALALFGVISTAIYKVFLTNQRAYNVQSQRSDLLQNLRLAAVFLPSELRELDARDHDIVAMSATSLTIRAMRQLGVTCTAPVLGASLTGRTVVLRSPLFNAPRAFATTDSIMLWYEGRAATRADDGWARGNITAITNVNCPDGRAGIQLTTNLILDGQPNTAGAIPIGVPVRGYETITYRVFQDTDNRYYLGIQTGNTTTAIIGPLVSANGVTFSYRDTVGNITAVDTLVGQIDAMIRAETTDSIQQRGSSARAVDSVNVSVLLRNNRRF